MSQIITNEQITKRAYEIYLRHGSQPGRDLENWLQAEAELRRELHKPAVVVSVGAAAPTAQPRPVAQVVQHAPAVVAPKPVAISAPAAPVKPATPVAKPAPVAAVTKPLVAAVAPAKAERRRKATGRIKVS